MPAKTKDLWEPVLEKTKGIIGFTTEDERLIQKASQHLLSESQSISSEMFQAVINYEPLAVILRDLSNNKGEGEKKLEVWIKSLLSGRYDDQFWDWHWIIGYIKAQHDDMDAGCIILHFGVLQTIISNKCFEIFEDHTALRISQALFKLVSCVSMLVFKSYRLAYQNAMESSGLNRTILNKMVAIQVKGLLQELQK